MNRTRTIPLWFIVFLAALAVLILPGMVAAAPVQGSLLGATVSTVTTDLPITPTIAVPGVFSLTFGDDMNATQLDILSLNAIASVDGLSLGQTVGWDAITLSQKQPIVTNAATISGAQVTVQGPSSGYSTDASAQISLHPSRALQADATVSVSYDGLNRLLGFTVQDAAISAPTWPVGLNVTGLNSRNGSLAIDSAQIDVPVAGSVVTVNGLKLGNGKASWDGITVAQSAAAPLKIGNVATISDAQVNIQGSGGGPANTASAHFEFNAGDVAHVEGEMIGVINRAGGPSGVALKDGMTAVQIPGWDLQLTGMNSVQGGMTVDKISFAAKPINLTAEMTGVTVGSSGGFTFDEAQITYLPGQDGGSEPTAGGFKMTMTKTDAGYILTTSTLLPIAAR